MPDISQIVAQWLESNGYDGLYNPGDCACLIGDLMPCGEPSPDCAAGYKVPCPGDTGIEATACHLDGDCGFHVVADRSGNEPESGGVI